MNESPEARALKDALPGIHAWFGDEAIEAAAAAVHEVALAEIYDEIRANGWHESEIGQSEALGAMLDRLDEARKR